MIMGEGERVLTPGISATLSQKRHDLKFATLRVHIDWKRLVPSQTWLRWSRWRRRIMSPRQSAKETALCGAVVLAVWASAWLAGFGSAVVQTTAAIPVEHQRAALPAADTERADTAQLAAMGNATVANIDVTPAEPETAMATTIIAAPDEPNTAAPDEPSMVVAALPDSSQVPATELPLVQVASADPSDPAPNDIKKAVELIEIPDECLVVDICIDRYLWALYQRTLKEDTLKVHERRKVTVKRKGKMVTVTRSFSRLVNQDFTWKDPKAAEKAGMPMMDYVIGGMDRSFKLKLFHTLRAAEEAGLSPGITSAFRDDYRQSIASGLKAATDRSYHGGSFRGGYGRGLAADVVSVKGESRAQRWVSTEKLWKWIDEHGKEFGIGRPYLDRDPAHMAPIDGKEYASRRGPKAQQAESQVKKRTRLAARNDHSVRRTNSAHRRKANMRVAAQVRR
ncbi:MAG TPA: peptidase M15 [Bradyrhizobium sp.]|nr:peptidase M15 [Bradyrhizobium sp.]